MSDYILPQHQFSELDRLLDVTNSHNFDLKRQYKRLQAPLSMIACEKAAVQQICRQLVVQQIVDRLEVQQYFENTSGHDFGRLVWMFVSKEPKDIARFLGVLTNITKYPVLSRKFRNKIAEFVPEDFLSLITRIVIDREECTRPDMENVLPVDVLGNTNYEDNETQQTSITEICYQTQENNRNGLNTNAAEVVLSQVLDIPNYDDRNQENVGLLVDENRTRPTIQVKEKSGFFQTNKSRIAIGILVVGGLFIIIISISFFLSAVPTELTMKSTTALPTTSTLEPHPDLNLDEVYETVSNTSWYSYRFLR